jgi:hypothetical protein
MGVFHWNVHTNESIRGSLTRKQLFSPNSQPVERRTESTHDVVQALRLRESEKALGIYVFGMKKFK